MKRVLPFLLAILLLVSCAPSVSPVATPTATPTSTPTIPKVDADLSAALEELYLTSFGGDGNKEWATDWYPYITSAEVVATGHGHYGIVSLSENPVDSGLDDETPKWIARAAYANFKDVYLTHVIIQTAEGNMIDTYDNTLPKP